MTVANERASFQTTVEWEQFTEELVAAFMRAASEISQQPSVRKTTLVALMDAAEEATDDLDALLGDFVDAFARVNVTDALLSLRERGAVRLTDEGFSLIDAPEPGLSESLRLWLMRLVGRKLEEWHLTPTPA